MTVTIITRCGGTICSLCDHFSLDLVTIVLVDLLLQGSWDEHVALLFKDLHAEKRR